MKSFYFAGKPKFMKKKMFSVGTLIVLFGLFSTAMFAQKEGFKKVIDESSFRKKMETVTLSTKSISSDFVQEKQLSFMEEPIISEGHFYFKKEQRIRWEYQQPFSYIVILNGSNLLIDDEGHTNEIDLKGNKTFQEINATINNSMQGKVWGDSKDFTPVLFENEALYLIQLTPETKQMQEYLTKIEVFFDKKTYQLEQVILLENGGDFTKISFENRKINDEVEEALFRL